MCTKGESPSLYQVDSQDLLVFRTNEMLHLVLECDFSSSPWAILKCLN